MNWFTKLNMSVFTWFFIMFFLQVQTIASINVKNRDDECVIVSRNRTLERCELLDSKTALCGGEKYFVKLWSCLPKPRPKSCVTCLVKKNDTMPSKKYENSVLADGNSTVPGNIRTFGPGTYSSKLEAKSRPKRGLRVYRFSSGYYSDLSIWEVIVIWLLTILFFAALAACDYACSMLCQKKPQTQTTPLIARDNSRRRIIRAIPMPWYNNYRQFSNDCHLGEGESDKSRLIIVSRVAMNEV